MQSGSRYSGGFVGDFLESVIITNLTNRRIPRTAVANCGEVRAIGLFGAFVLRGGRSGDLAQRIEGGARPLDMDRRSHSSYASVCLYLASDVEVFAQRRRGQPIQRSRGHYNVPTIGSHSHRRRGPPRFLLCRARRSRGPDCDRSREHSRRVLCRARRWRG